MGSMTISKIALGISTVLAAQAISAQQLPIPVSAKEGASLSIKQKLSAQERDFFWKNTAVAADGYLRIVGSKEEVDIVDEATKLPFLKSTAEEQFRPAILTLEGQGFPFIGAWKEDKYRSTLLFGNSITGLLMYTIYEYGKANSSVTLAKDFVRYNVKKSPAVLTLTVAEGKGLWKLSTWRRGRAHEIYLTDELLSSGNPRRGYQQILRIAESVID